MTAPLAVEPKSHAFLPRPLTPQSSVALDLIRALAACAVVSEHLRAIFFLDYQHLPRRTFFLDFLYFVTGLGHQAVVVFFVLSGFLISSGIMRRHALGTLSWRDYAIDRATRLYVVLVPGLLLGLLWDVLGTHRASFLYSHSVPAFGNVIAQKQLSLSIFLGNLAFLQTILFPAFGSNGPLWSLSNEFWYYLLFPVLFASGIAFLRRKIAPALLLLIASAVIVWFVGGEIFAGFFVWLAGWLLARTDVRFRLPSSAGRFVMQLCSSILLAMALVAVRFGRPSSRASDFAVGLAFALFLYALLQLQFRRFSPSWARFARFFAGFSYSLYVLHFPFLLFLSTFIAPVGTWRPDAIHLFYALVLGAVVLVYAWIISLFTEARTHSVRTWVRTLFTAQGIVPSVSGS